MDSQQIELMRLLVERLERLSADSHWARRASGLRGNLLKFLEESNSINPSNQERFDLLINSAFNILKKAAQEIPDKESILGKSGGRKGSTYE